MIILIARVAWQVHQMTVTRRYVLSARWPLPRGVSNLVALPCDDKMSQMSLLGQAKRAPDTVNSRR
jgi:hypothetical protein